MSSTDRSVAGQDWFEQPAVRTVFALLNVDGGEVRIVGGAIRNALMGEPVADVDMATTWEPEEVMKRAQAAGIKSVPTGIDHGTVTLVVEGRAIEVTTLRTDVETTGRHAVVAFGKDWQADAERRDFTINALYADAQGHVHDPVGGLQDIDSRTVRFIGEAERRIAEDHLRILRFFRFFAWYGGGRPDAVALKACVRQRETIAKLSAERIWKEFRLLLSAPDPSRALLWMRQTGILTLVLPESEKWGIDAISGLIATERDNRWPADPMLRLIAMVPPDAVRMSALAERLKMSRAEADRLAGWAKADAPQPGMAGTALDRQLYRQGTVPVIDRLRLAIATIRSRAEAPDGKAMAELAGLAKLLRRAEDWTRPDFPLSGKDLIAAGLAPGETMGRRLKLAQEKWVESNFALDRDALLKLALESG